MFIVEYSKNNCVLKFLFRTKSTTQFCQLHAKSIRVSKRWQRSQQRHDPREQFLCFTTLIFDLLTPKYISFQDSWWEHFYVKFGDFSLGLSVVGISCGKTNRPRDRQTDRQTDRHKHRWTSHQLDYRWCG